MAKGKGSSKARSLIIHMGVQKTGSTAFHNFVQRNRDALAAHLEIFTPTKGSSTRALGRAMRLFSLGSLPEAEARAEIARLRAELLAAPGTGPILLSHENLPGAMPGSGPEAGAPLFAHLEQILALLCDGLAPFEPQFVFMTRDMASWKPSVYAQAVQSDGYAGSWETFVVETADCGGWDALAARAEAVLGAERLHLLRLEAESDRTRPGSQILRLCGVPQAVIAELAPLASAHNARPAAGAVEFLRSVNALNLPRETRADLARLVRERAALFAADYPRDVTPAAEPGAEAPRLLCIATHHKTGTVWMRRVWRLIGEALNIPFVPVHNPDKWQKIPSAGRVIVANWAGSFAPELFARADARFLHLIRDPRDVLLSGARYHETASGKQERFLHSPRPALGGKSYQEHLQGLPELADKLDFEMRNMHQKTLEQMRSWPYGHPRALDLRYEDLIADEDAALFGRVLAFFGLTGAEAEVARRIYLENSLFGGLEAQGSTGRVAGHVVSGAARQWPAALPRKSAAAYLDRHGADLIALGYEQDESWLSQLDPGPATERTRPLAGAAGGMSA